ncbi:MAG: hypothetical protein IPP18_15125 [Rhodocyclaceae bacterium]|nr:hypothetical protein [Rhodocyclaceae bacterium]
MDIGRHRADPAKISEPHLLQMIEQRLREKNAAAEAQAPQAEARERGIATVKSPPPVAGLRATEAVRTFYFDPSFTLDHNITSAPGRVLLPPARTRTRWRW